MKSPILRWVADRWVADRWVAHENVKMATFQRLFWRGIEEEKPTSVSSEEPSLEAYFFCTGCQEDT